MGSGIQAWGLQGEKTVRPSALPCVPGALITMTSGAEAHGRRVALRHSIGRTRDGIRVRRVSTAGALNELAVVCVEGWGI
jgi:hypothetical protein